MKTKTQKDKILTFLTDKSVFDLMPSALIRG